MNLHLQRTQYESQALQMSTSAEFREALQAIIDNQNEMRRLLAIPSPQPVEQVMQHLQEASHSDVHLCFFLLTVY